MKENKLKIVSLFSGIGGFEEGIKKTNILHEVVFASEIDEMAKKSYIANFKEVNVLGDIRKVSEKNIPDHDLLVAGFPCQAFSIAGKLRGFDDIRGTLFFEIVRVLNFKKPPIFILENVKNLLNHDNSKTINIIVENLSKLGYTIDFSLINSTETGVPQNRERVYFVGILNGEREDFKNDKRSTKVSELKMMFNIKKINSFNFFNNISFNNKNKKIKDVLLENVPEKYFIKTEKLIEYLSKVKIENINFSSKNGVIKLIDLPKEVYNDLERQRRVYSIDGISPTILARSDTTKILINKDNKLMVRKLTPEENFFVQGFDKKFVDNIKSKGISDTQMYKQSGNSVTPNVIKGIFENLIIWFRKRK